MNVYIYSAALYCEECGNKIRADLDAIGKRPTNIDNECTYDSDDYPKGPYPDGGGEADIPQHCDACHILLGNPLTSDGERYVRDAISERGEEFLQEWREYYSYLFE